ncbi:MAG: hypothetical protein ACR2PL_15780 [Dehalococcoidia bacterium]
MNMYFDVDHTIIDSDNRLRPGVRALFERLVGGCVVARYMAG